MPKMTQLEAAIALEKEMDAGTQPFVRHEKGGPRIAVNNEIMARFGLTTGQVINDVILDKLMRLQIRKTRAKMLKDTKKLIVKANRKTSTKHKLRVVK